MPEALGEKLADGALWYTIFLFSTTFHEAAHAFAAMRMGDLTAYMGGQVTLNPLPHIRREPVGTVVVPLLSFLIGGWMMGWASAPYDPAWALRNPRRSALMALAGPAANLVLILIAALLIHGGAALGVLIPPERITFMHITEAVGEGAAVHVATMISVLFSLNLVLLVFNLIPLPPLDGSGALPLFMPQSVGQKYMSAVHRSGLALFGIFIAWRLFDTLYPPIHLFAINLLYPDVAYR
jgi:Zn-dependent protease